MEHEMLTCHEDIEQWLKKHGVENYEITSEGVVNVTGFVPLRNKSLKYIPVQFGHIEGSFDCSCNQIKSLKGCPYTISGDFRCVLNQLSSLEYGPVKVGGDYECFENKLTTLKFSPSILSGYFDCSYNQLSSLEHGPIEVERNFYAEHNKLINLKHCPTKVGGDFIVVQNYIENLKELPLLVGGQILLINNPIKTLEHLNNKTIPEDVSLGISLEHLDKKYNGLIDLYETKEYSKNIYCQIPIGDILKYNLNLVLENDLGDKTIKHKRKI